MPTDLLTIVRDPAAREALRAYFAETGRTYTGRHFERLGGGGDDPLLRDFITAQDLIAVEMLSVQVPAEVARDLLDGPLRFELRKHLLQVPTQVELGTEAAAGLVDEGSAANAAWRLLVKQDGVSWVIAGKLLARKRPMLIPVWDNVVSCQFGHPTGDVWKRFEAALAANGGELRGELASLRARAETPPAVSLLRVLDVVLWMRHHSDHRKTGCPGFGTAAF